MLSALHIENFAIVSCLDLEFSNAMTVFTGETGAGKSIMIDALMLALGGRTDASVVRPGTQKCDVSATFHVDESSPALRWLNAHEIAHDEGEIILKRVLYPEGRSKSFINGEPFPQQKVKEIAEHLVDIHGQHQHQTLLNHQTHRLQLDQYADHKALLLEVEHRYRECMTLQVAREALDEQSTSVEHQQLLQYQIEELRQLSLQKGEWALLHEEHQRLHHAKDYLECSEDIRQRLKQDDTFSVTRALSQILHLFSQLPQDNPLILNAMTLLQEAAIQCEEACDEITRFSRTVELNPTRLGVVEARMSVLHQMARKYHVDVDALDEQWVRLEAELATLLQSDKEKKRLDDAYAAALTAYEDAALALRASRQTHAKALCQEISAYIQKLGMPEGFIELRFTPLTTMQPHGLDRVEYFVCTNPGMSPDALAKIASGGELSRLSLAIQMIVAAHEATPTLIFDEVDVGIGGATAALVGKMLHHLGQTVQVFCVTHQAQVAAAADAHFLVSKVMKEGQTYSEVKCLQPTEKVKEIARMMSGFTVTEQTLSHARELMRENG